MIASVELLEIAELVAIAGTAGIVYVHTRRRHRTFRRIGPRFDPDHAHVLRETERGSHRCICGRDAQHDIHHRTGGIG